MSEEDDRRREAEEAARREAEERAAAAAAGAITGAAAADAAGTTTPDPYDDIVRIGGDIVDVGGGVGNIAGGIGGLVDPDSDAARALGQVQRYTAGVQQVAQGAQAVARVADRLFGDDSIDKAPPKTPGASATGDTLRDWGGTAGQVGKGAGGVENAANGLHGILGDKGIGKTAGDVAKIAGQVKKIAGQSQKVLEGAGKVADKLSKKKKDGDKKDGDKKEGKTTVEKVVEKLLPKESVLPKVEYTFETKTDPLVVWFVRRVELTEGLSQLYACVVDLATEDLDVDLELLVGAHCTLTLERDPHLRWLDGIIHRVESRGLSPARDKRLIRVHVGPALMALEQRIDSRIFQTLAIPDILAEVLKEGLEPFGRKHRMELRREYSRREYCVQYRESDLAFVMRLMEEEGISFYFDHPGEAEELVLVDSNDPLPVFEGPDGETIELHGDELAKDESISRLDWETTMRSTSIVIRDFDWTQPELDLTAEQRGKDGRKRDREVYDYPAALAITDYDEEQGRYKKDDARTRARLRREELVARQRVGHGRSNVTGLVAGARFTLSGHHLPALDRRYLVTKVVHHGQAPDVLIDEMKDLPKGEGEARYSNTFEVMPAEVPCRPIRVTPRPLVHGTQTAIVVGPDSEEIHTDRHGRIKVQLHWDRDGVDDERSSCWIRVAQSWAGSGFGLVFVPRIGMEVIVDFLEGNPDRPIVIGCVYNGQNVVPWDLPDHKTRTVLRTQSTPGGGGHNELHFEDAKSKEEIYLRAQRDMREEVLHDHTTFVENDQSNSVLGNQTESVTGDQSLHVQSNRRKTIDKDETTEVRQHRTETVFGNETITVRGNRVEKVEGAETIQVAGARTEKVGAAEKIEIGSSRSVTVGGSDSISVSSGFSVSAASMAMTQGGSTSLTMTEGAVGVDAAKKVTFKHGSALVELEESGKVKVVSGVEIELVVGGCIVRMAEGKIEVTAPMELVLTSGTAAVKLDAQGLTQSGANVRTSAESVHEITGLVVKIN